MKQKFKHLILCGILLALCLGVVYYKYFAHDRTFSPEEWENNPNERISLIDSLTTEYSLIGMNREQILNLLGNKDVIMNNSDMIEYMISLGIGDVVGFIIFFDENDIVYDYKMSPH